VIKPLIPRPGVRATWSFCRGCPPLLPHGDPKRSRPGRGTMLKLQNPIRWVSLGQIMGRFTMIYCLMPGNPGIRREKLYVQSPNPPIMFLYVSVMFCGLKSEEISKTMLPHHAPSSKSKLRNAFNPQTTSS